MNDWKELNYGYEWMSECGDIWRLQARDPRDHTRQLERERQIERQLIEQFDWVNDANKELKKDPMGLVESFIEAYSVKPKDIPRITRILDKKNSDRTEEERNIIRLIVKTGKKEIPLIDIERHDDNDDEEEGDTEDDEDYEYGPRSPRNLGKDLQKFIYQHREWMEK